MSIDPALVFDWAKSYVVREAGRGRPKEEVDAWRTKQGVSDDEWSAAIEKAREHYRTIAEKKQSTALSTMGTSGTSP